MRNMALIKVEGETPDEEFEEVAERAYKKINKEKLGEVETQPQLIKLLEEEYFHEKGYDRLMPGVAKAFYKKGWVKEREIVEVEMPKVQPEAQEIAEKPVTIDLEKFKKPKKAKQVKLKLYKESTDETLSSYIDSRPSRTKKDKIYKVTKSKKLIKREVYLKRLINLRIGWNAKRTKKQG